MEVEKVPLHNIKLADDVEYIIIQRENPNDNEKLDGEIIALITHEGYQIAGGYILRTKFGKTVKKEKD